MHKADFEKKVQEKMHELRFPPSDEVWKRVEAGIGKDKRHPLFYWLPAALVMLGVVGYFSYVNLSASYKYSNQPSGTKTNQPGQSIANKQNVPESKESAASKITTTPSASIEKNGFPKSDLHASINASKKSFHENLENSGSSRLPQPIIESMIEDRIPPPTNSNRGLHYSLPLSDERASFIVSFAQQKVSSRNDLNSSQKTPSIPIAKKNNWEYQLSLSVGISNLTDGLLKGDSLGRMYYSPGSSSMGSGYRPSEVRNGLSFAMGATANKWLGAKWNVGIGLQYQYFSNSITIGEKIDSAILVPQNNTALSTVSGYYKSAGNTPYHNQYHFISLPLTVNWQFTPRFTWENQAIYSRLVYTNAMQFDGAYGVYYKDENIFNKNQFIFATALKFGWNKNKFQVGPQLQYSSTNLFAAAARDSKHLYSVAIKANMKLSKN